MDINRTQNKFPNSSLVLHVIFGIFYLALTIYCFSILSKNLVSVALKETPSFSHIVTSSGYIFLLVFGILTIESYILYLFFRKRQISTVILGQLLLFILFFFQVASFGDAYRILSQKASNEIVQSVQSLNDGKRLAKNHILSSVDSIASQLDQSYQVPVVVVNNTDRRAIEEVLFTERKKNSSFYDKYFLPLHIQLLNTDNLLSFKVLYFPNKLLLIKDKSIDSITTLALPLSRNYILSYFPSDSLRDDKPMLQVLNEKEYEKKADLERKNIKDQYQINRGKIQAYIVDTTDYIQRTESLLNSYPYEDSYKQAVRNELNKAYTYRKEAGDDLALSEKYFKEYEKNPVTPELEYGHFIYPNEIYIKYLKDDIPFTLYLSTSIHEYMHFYSSKDVSIRLSPFLNEGLAEYFTQKLEKKYILTDNTGYPYEVKVISLLAKKIPHGSLSTIYFSQDEELFKRLFQQYFPDVNYDRFITKSNEMFFTSPTDFTHKDAVYFEIEALLSK